MAREVTRGLRDPALLAVILAILVLGLAPLPTAREAHDSWLVGVGFWTARDIWLNVLFFVPFGFTARRLARPGIRVSVTVTVAGALLSFVVETVQTALPARFPSLIDVAANAIGTSVGVSCFWLWRTRRLISLAAGYVAAVAGTCILLDDSARVATWDPTYPLLVGNEASGDRPWNGRVWNLLLADKALSGTQLEASMAASRQTGWSGVPDDVRSSVVAFYNLASTTACRDVTGNLGPLLWQDGRPCPSDGGPPRVDSHAWLRTTAAPTLAERIQRTERFTLVATIEAADRRARGPARIVSMSSDPNNRNFTVGQEQDALVVRFRTNLTGLNASRIELVGRGVIETDRPQTVAVTYDGSRLSLFVDAPRSVASLRFGPGLAAMARVAPRAVSQRFASTLPFDAIFLAILFAPAVALVAARRAVIRHDSAAYERGRIAVDAGSSGAHRQVF